MGREAIYRALYSDTELNNLGIARTEIFPNYVKDETPTRTKRFLILRWEEIQVNRAVRTGPTVLTVWAHCPTTLSNDFSKLDAILERVKVVLEGLEHFEGTDGKTVTNVIWTGTGGDFKDPGYDTITKNSAFKVLFR